MNLALIGERLSHSYSAYIHNALGSGYQLVQLPRATVAEFVKTNGLDGYNVTIPYKEEVIPHLDWVSGGASAIGAVNTVTKCGGKSFGHNTDLVGMWAAFLRRGISLNGKTVMILGGGGTSKTAQALSAGAAHVYVVGRNGAINYDNYTNYAADTDILINTTPVGMYPDMDAAPLSLKPFTRLKFVFDAIYNPKETELLYEAHVLGIPVENGLFMLAAQAKFAYDLFGAYYNADARGLPAPKDGSRRLLTAPDGCTKSGVAEIERLYNLLRLKTCNIVLIGMPGCGKSSKGRVIADTLSYEFVDTDDLIVRAAGKSIPEIFADGGEAVFRDYEEAAVREAAARKNAVIAVGGGAVLRGENRKRLRRCGTVVYVKRDLNELAFDGRPLSKDAAAVEKMYGVRKPLYEGTADVTAEGRGTVEECAADILRLLGR
ncbi:MAG: shikimate dehydrogenase [Clostridiaceae bacterium]|jgi:shikimate dehydrogenase|nr:shikimate dehydrogenase [Clostridiaceae bacterium]